MSLLNLVEATEASIHAATTTRVSSELTHKANLNQKKKKKKTINLVKEKSESSEVLNKAGENRRKDRSKSCFFGKMFYIFDDSRKKKQEYRSFFSFLMNEEACEMRGSEMTNEMKNSNGNKRGGKEDRDKRGSDVNNQEDNRVASH